MKLPIWNSFGLPFSANLLPGLATIAVSVLFVSLPASSQTAPVTTMSPRMHGLLYPSFLQKADQPRGISREERDGELSVLTRRSPSYNPPNIRFQELVIAPSLETGFQYTDNVYATNQRKRKDTIITVRPEVVIRSDLPLHEINADLYYENGSFQKLSEEDYQDFGATLGGRYDLYQGFSLPLGVGYAHNHSRRDDVDERRSKEPTVFDVATTQTGIRLSGNRIEFNERTGLENFSFEDTKAFGGGTIDNMDRNRTVLSHYVSLGAPTEAYIAPFAYASHKTISYEKSRDNFGIKRDSREIEAGIGSIFNLSPISWSSFRVGDVWRKYDDSTIEPIIGLTYSANLNWDATTLAAFSLSGTRGIRETSANAAARIDTTVLLGMTYEIAPNLLLRPQLGYLNKRYRQSNFTSNAYTAGAEVLYKLNPNIWATLKCDGSTQTQKGGTTLGSESYDENTISLSLKFQL